MTDEFAKMKERDEDKYANLRLFLFNSPKLKIDSVVQR